MPIDKETLEVIKVLLAEQAKQNEQTIAAAVAAAIKAAKEPTEIEQRKINAENAEIARKQERRKNLGRIIKKKEAAEKAKKHNCPHMHPITGKNATTYVEQEIGGESGKFLDVYVKCQKCNVLVRPENSFLRETYNGPYCIFDTAIFNKLAAQCMVTAGQDMFA